MRSRGPNAPASFACSVHEAAAPPAGPRLVLSLPPIARTPPPERCPAMQPHALLDALRRAGLLSPEQLAEAAHLAALPSFDQELTARGLLTPFQLTEVSNGRGAFLAFGDYVLLDRVGAGGMGEVFKARHRLGGHEAALKRILPGRLDAADAV